MPCSRLSAERHGPDGSLWRDEPTGNIPMRRMSSRLYSRPVLTAPYEKKLLGITAMQKMLGKTKFEKLLSAYIEKPQGKPTLVPESDKRPEISCVNLDFKE